MDNSKIYDPGSTRHRKHTRRKMNKELDWEWRFILLAIVFCGCLLTWLLHEYPAFY